MMQHNSQSNSAFMNKFSNRIEVIGKDGVLGIMKTTKIPINFNRQSFTPNFPNNRYINYPTINPCPSYPSQNFLPTHLSQNRCNPTISFSSQALPRLVQRSVVTEANNNIVDHGYTPYSLSDYRKLQKEVKLGGLGANIGGKEWRERARRRIKMDLYGSKLNKNKKCVSFKTESPVDVREKEKRDMIAKSKRTKIAQYGKNLIEERKKAKMNFEDMFRIHRDNVIKIEDEEAYENSKEIYLTRLNKIKNCFLK